MSRGHDIISRDQDINNIHMSRLCVYSMHCILNKDNFVPHTQEHSFEKQRLQHGLTKTNFLQILKIVYKLDVVWHIDETILSWVRGHKIPFLYTPAQTKVLRCIMGAHEWEAADREITSLRTKGVLDRSTHEEGKFISNLFLQPKKQEGKFRQICRLIWSP